MSGTSNPLTCPRRARGERAGCALARRKTQPVHCRNAGTQTRNERSTARPRARRPPLLLARHAGARAARTSTSITKERPETVAPSCGLWKTTLGAPRCAETALHSTSTAAHAATPCRRAMPARLLRGAITSTPRLLQNAPLRSASVRVDRHSAMQFYYNSGIPQRQRRTRDGRTSSVNRCALPRAPCPVQGRARRNPVLQQPVGCRVAQQGLLCWVRTQGRVRARPRTEDMPWTDTMACTCPTAS